VLYLSQLKQLWTVVGQATGNKERDKVFKKEKKNMLNNTLLKIQ